MTVAEARAILVADRALGMGLAHGRLRGDDDPPDFGPDEREAWRRLAVAASEFLASIGEPDFVKRPDAERSEP